MTSNLLRVVRGAGKPHEIGSQAVALVEALVGYRGAVGTFPPADEMSGFLDVDYDREMLAQCSERERVRVYAQERVMRSALQIAASRLIGQGTQEAAGDYEMHGGIREFEAIREEERRTFAAASAGRVRARVPATQPRKPKV